MDRTASYKILEEIIQNRHTVKAKKMNGKEIPKDQIKNLLQLADLAPTHGKTEPWRFWIYQGEALNQFGKKHADLYWTHSPEEKRKKSKYDKLIKYAENASHLIIVVMKRTEKTRIPASEELAAVSAATEHILLGATALGISSFWNTGGMAKHFSLKEHLQLQEEDRIVGLLYLGYSDAPIPKRKRRISLEEKTNWITEN